MAKQGIVNHPKLIELASELNIDRCHAVGILECLWQFTAQYAPDGAVGRIKDRIIASGIGCSGIKPMILLNALVDTNWLDEVEGYARYYVHDWHVHCETWVRDKLAKEGKSFYGGLEATRGPGRPPGPSKSRNSEGENPSAKPIIGPNYGENNSNKNGNHSIENPTENLNKTAIDKAKNPRARPSPSLPSQTREVTINQVPFTREPEVQLSAGSDSPGPPNGNPHLYSNSDPALRKSVLDGRPLSREDWDAEVATEGARSAAERDRRRGRCG